VTRRWGSIPLRSRLSRVIYAVVVLALVTWYLWFRFQHVQHRPRTSPAVEKLDMTEKLVVTDASLRLVSGSECRVAKIPWQIEGYGSRFYQIDWTVTHDEGQAWTWKNVTDDAAQQGDLSVLVCPNVAGAGESGYTVTGVLEAATYSPQARGTAPPVAGKLSVRVQG
jgi:hypothetical protein